MINALLDYHYRGVYQLHEFVIMPNHIHLLLTPSQTNSLERAIQYVKGGSSHRIHKAHGSRMEIWQPGFHDWTVRDPDDWREKVGYIHNNPVRAKLVGTPEAWPYSSANGSFDLEAAPSRFAAVTSGAKAPVQQPQTSGLKSRPPVKLTATTRPLSPHP